MKYPIRDEADRRWRNAPVREPDHGKAWQLLGWLALMLIACSPVAFYLFQQMEYIETMYRTEALRNERARLIEAERLLRVETASLEALPRVEREADRLGLVPASPEQIIVVVPSGPPDDSLVAGVTPADR